MDTPAYNEYTWRDGAACRASDPELFFPEKGTTVEMSDRAKRLCGGCAVRALCLEYAIESKQTTGIWGGEDFAALSRARRAAYFRGWRAAS